MADLPNELREVGRAADDMSHELWRVTHGLWHLSTDFDLMEHTIVGVDHAHDWVVGSDVIDAGAGNDTVVGDEGLLVAPPAIGTPIDPDILVSSSLEYHNSLRDVAHVAIDFEHVVSEARAQTLDALVADAIANNPRRKKPKKWEIIGLDRHDLSIGNDTISGAAGNDVIIGDQGVIVAPLVSSQALHRDSAAMHELSKNVRKDAQRALRDQEKARDRALKDHLKYDHDDFHHRFPKKRDINLIPYRFGLDVSIGNDVIYGGDGDDVIVGDFGVIIAPALAQTPTTRNQARQLNHEIEHVLRDVDDLLLDYHCGHGYHGYYHHGRDGGSGRGWGGHGYDGSDGGWDVRRGHDVIDAGAGNDIVLGDNGALAPQFSHHGPMQYPITPLSMHGHHHYPGFHFGSHGGSDGGDDVIVGGSGDDLLLGQGGADTIYGNEGKDNLYGGGGKDALDGGPGRDVVRRNGCFCGAGRSFTFGNPWLAGFAQEIVEAVDHLNPNTDLWITFDDRGGRHDWCDGGSDGGSDGGGDSGKNDGNNGWGHGSKGDDRGKGKGKKK